MHGRKFFGRGFRAVKLHFEEHQLPVVVGRRALQLDIARRHGVDPDLVDGRAGLAAGVDRPPR